MLQMWGDCTKEFVGTYSRLSFLRLYCRPRCQCRSEYPNSCKARAWPSGANVHRWVPRFLRSPCVYAWGVVTQVVQGFSHVASSPDLTRKRAFCVRVWKIFARLQARKNLPHDHI